MNLLAFHSQVSDPLIFLQETAEAIRKKKTKKNHHRSIFSARRFLRTTDLKAKVPEKGFGHIHRVCSSVKKEEKREK